MRYEKKEQEGLTSRQAADRLRQYGPNCLVAAKKTSKLKVFLSQFRDTLVLILLASTVISVLMGNVTEAFVIIILIIINALLGFVQEYRTSKSLEMLKRLSSPLATAIRDGQPQTIEAEDLVPSDVILLEAGDRIPADCKIITSVSLACDESMLSGESLPVEKQVGEGHHLAFMGTIVTKGRGKALVTATGMDTEMGKIAGMLEEIEEDPTPLQVRLNQLGKYIGFGCLLISGIIALTGILRGEAPFDMLITAIALAVAAVPEGLPAIVTIALALAVGRILKRNALIKHLHAVETLGCADVICTDKTGTLTENRMTVKEIDLPGCHYQVTGNGYDQNGQILGPQRKSRLSEDIRLKQLLTIAVACNNATICAPRKSFLGLKSSEGQWEISGDPTEAALLIMGAKGGILAEGLPYAMTGEIPFDSIRKRMSVQVKDREGKEYLFTKGAPDILLERCGYYLSEDGVRPLIQSIKTQIMQSNSQMAGSALRVLGFCYRDGGGISADQEQGMIFVGMAGMIDPPRKEAYRAVIDCRYAGIRPIMITGDHKDTAAAIAKELKIMTAGDRLITGDDLAKMSDEELYHSVESAAVFARVNPSHKLRIVSALKRRGHIVAMTGDGVNDAPAVKEADIGVSMGVTGTDVTKEAASLILLDDNFATLVAAVEEGRVIYNNIRKFIRYLLSCNIGEVVTMFVGMLMGMPLVLLPMQILFINLVTDGLPAIALGVEPAPKDIMRHRPRQKNESIFAGGLLSTIIFRGVLIGFTTLAVFATLFAHTHSLEMARTGALAALVITQLFHVIECKSETKGIFSVPLFDNIQLLLAVLLSAILLIAVIYFAPLQALFNTVPLAPAHLLSIFVFCSFVPIISAALIRFKSTFHKAEHHPARHKHLLSNMKKQ